MSRKLGNWISAYMQYSAFSESPDKFHFWTAISTIAGAVRRQVWIDMGYFQWTPNFYIIFVAPPGIVAKSTTASIGMDLLKKVDGVIFGPQVVTWQSLVTSMAQSTKGVQIGDELHAMSAITIVSSELGSFLNPQDREMVDILVDLWDGRLGTWEKATKTQGGDSIENPWINVIGCTTPSWIAGNFPDYMIGGGFTSRTIFVYAEKKRSYVAYPADHMPANIEEMKELLVHDLQEIANEVKGPMTLTKEAKVWGTQWYQELWENRPAHLDNEHFAGYLARKQTHIHKIATILSIADSNNRTIEKSHLEAASQLTVGLEEDMPKVFGHIGKTDITRAAGELVVYVYSVGPITPQALFQHFFARFGAGDYDKILQAAMQAGYVAMKRDGTKMMIIPTGLWKQNEKDSTEPLPDLAKPI